MNHGLGGVTEAFTGEIAEDAEMMVNDVTEQIMGAAIEAHHPLTRMTSAISAFSAVMM